MNVFESEVQQSAKALDLLYQKIPIAHKLCKNGPRTFMLPLQENPYDSFLVVRGIHCALELKSTKEWEAFPFARLEPHQRQGLQAVHDAGGYSFVLLNMRQRTVNGKRKLDNQAWGIPYPDWLVLEHYYQALHGRKSLPLEALVKGYQLPRITVAGTKGKVWDLTTLFR